MSEKVVYVAEAGNAIKIGVSKNPEKRIKKLNTANAHDVSLKEELTQLNESRTAQEWEEHIHEELSDYALSGEWFAIEALDQLYEIIDFEDTEELTKRQEHALGVAKTLENDFPDDLKEYDMTSEEVTNIMPEEDILQRIVDAYNLPHGVCGACCRLAYYHRSDDGQTCQIYGGKNI